MSVGREGAGAIDPALAEALTDWRTQGRLSNDAVHALKMRKRAMRRAASGVVAVLIVASAFHYRNSDTPQIARLETGRGETRSVRLPDGSRVRLAGATRLTLRYDGSERSVALTQGAAFFDVTHDPDRPFTIRAGDGDVRVLGTAFDVDRTEGRMEVVVYRGAVRLSGENDPRGEWVPAGWHSHVTRGHASPAARSNGESDDQQRGWLDVNDLRLIDLVTILNRQSGPVILPPSPDLAEISITGRFQTDNPHQLLKSLGTYYGFTVTDDGGAIVVSSK